MDEFGCGATTGNGYITKYGTLVSGSPNAGDAYDSSNENWHGPRDAYQYLPSTITWNNPGLIAPGTRSIVAEKGSTSGRTIESFTYTDKAARFLTTQELVSACSSISSVGNFSVGELDGWTWLMENIGRYGGNSGSYGYWLETPSSDDPNYVWACMVIILS